MSKTAIDVKRRVLVIESESKICSSAIEQFQLTLCKILNKSSIPHKVKAQNIRLKILYQIKVTSLFLLAHIQYINYHFK